MEAPSPAENSSGPQSQCTNESSTAKWRWQDHFTLVSRHNGNFKVSCNYCQGALICGGATRFRKHLLAQGGVRACSGVPDEVVDVLRREFAEKQAQGNARKQRDQELLDAEREAKRAKLQQLSHSLSTGSACVNKKWKQSTMDECKGAAELEIAQQAVARMWYRAAIPFDAIGYDDVLNAFDAVCDYAVATGNRTFMLPTVPALRNQRLDKEVQRIEGELELHRKSIAKFGLSLQSDGKDAMSRRHLVNIITTTPMGPEFRETIDVSGQSRDAAHTADALMDATNRLPAEDKSNLITVVTDTPNVNKAAWKIIEEKLKKVSCLPCAAHCCNLHFKHIARDVPEFNELVDECKLIVRRCKLTPAGVV